MVMATTSHEDMGIECHTVHEHCCLGRLGGERERESSLFISGRCAQSAEQSQREREQDGLHVSATECSHADIPH